LAAVVAAVQHHPLVLLGETAAVAVVVDGVLKQVVQEHPVKEIRVVLVAQQQLLLLMEVEAGVALVR
jgi:hypothetical protein